MEITMTVQELYDHITSQITPEEALKRILRYSVEQYRFLREQDKSHGNHPETIACAAAMELGWKICFRVGEGSDEVDGVIIGTEEFLEELMDYEPMKRDKYSIWTHPLNNGKDH